MKIISISGFLSEAKENGKTTKRVNYKVVIDEEIERRDKDGKKVMRNYFSASLTTLCNAIMPYGIMIQSKMAQYTSQLVISDVLSAFLLGAEIEIKNEVQKVGTIINGEASKVETMKTLVTSAKPVSDPLLESFRLQMLSSLDAKVAEVKAKLEEEAKKAVLPNPFATITQPTPSAE